MPRLRDLVEALACHEAPPWRLWLMDDCDPPRPLHDLLRPLLPDGAELRVEVPRHDRLRRRRYALTEDRFLAGTTMTGLRAIADAGPAPVVLKIDTDALVIAPFAVRLASLLADHPEVGLLGACRWTPNGTPRDLSDHARFVRLIRRPPRFGRTPREIWRWWKRCHDPLLRPVRRTIERAFAHGYELAEHALGGGLALRGDVLRRNRRDGLLDPAAWDAVDFTDDVMIGLLCRAAGRTLRDDVEPGGVFGVRYIGLPFLPDELVQKRYAIIHSLKNDPRIGEPEIRRFFRERRTAASPVTAGRG